MRRLSMSHEYELNSGGHRVTPHPARPTPVKLDHPRAPVNPPATMAYYHNLSSLLMSFNDNDVCLDGPRITFDDFMTYTVFAMASILSVTLMIHTCSANTPKQQPPAPGSWYAVGLYDLRKPQSLTKVEREAASQHDGTNAVLYEKTHPSGTHSWRYSLDGHTWYYPTRTAVIRRGRTDSGDLLMNTVED